MEKTAEQLIQTMLEERVRRLEKGEQIFKNYGGVVEDIICQLPPESVTSFYHFEYFHLSCFGDKAYFTRLYKLLRAAKLKPLSPPEDKPQSTYSAHFYNDKEDIVLFLYFTSTVCKLTKIGEETVTRPVYEVVCE